MPEALPDADRQFIEEVMPAELAEIARRRRDAGVRPPGAGTGASTARELVGLAFSGGGIRSATFSLGVLQVLAARGVLRLVDYLSTVSGGGFTGSAVSALLNDRTAEPDGAAFPLAAAPGLGDAPALRHLRNGQHYLAPGGLLDTVRMPALMVKGILLNLLMVVPYIMLAVSATDLVNLVLGGPVWFFTWIPLFASGSFAAYVVTVPVVTRLLGARFSWPERNRYERLGALAFFGMVLSLILIPFFILVDTASWMMPADLLLFVTMLASRVYQWAGIVMSVVLVLAVAAGFSPALARLRHQILLYSVGVLGPAIVLALYLVGCVLEIDPPGTNGRVALQLSPAASVEEVAALNAGQLPDRLRALAVPDPTGVRGVPQTSITPGAVLGDAPVVTTMADDHHWRVTVQGRAFVLSAKPYLRVWWAEDRSLQRGIDWKFLAVALGWLAFNAVFGNVNTSSAHGFYRDRISRAYLVRRERGGAVTDDGLESADGMKLSDLCEPGTKAPYHLVNASLNLNGTLDLDVRGRNCDFFTFSKHFTGGRRTGYASTPDLEALHPHLNLGTAVAISGAAAAPNSGVTTESSLTFIMTLLDIRMGYWLPSPAYVRDAPWWRRALLRMGTGPRYLVKEALGQVSSGGSFVNLSDGGHIENLAIYQLLRRRCKLIIAVDGEQDYPLRFDGLLKLMLYARIDLGVDIQIDLDQIRRASTGLSTAHCTVGKITYGASEAGVAETGWLVYLKASLTGDEDEVMRDYHFAHPEFPHESTANQFFNERQWEMYRSLGVHVAEGALAAAGSPEMDDIQDFLEHLWTAERRSTR